METPTLSRVFRRTTLSTLIVAAFTIAHPSVAQAQASLQTVAESPRQFDIPAVPLNQAITEFSRQTGLNVFFEGEADLQSRSSVVRGNITPTQALQTLLLGSGFEIGGVSSNGYRLKPVSSVTNGSSTLPAVTVSGSTEIDPVRNSGFRRSSNRSALGVNADIMETPATVNTLSGEFLEAINARRLEDALAYVPGVAFDTGTTGGAFPSINIRGFSSQSSTSGDVFVDGLVVNRRAYVPDLSLYDRVEILKGASSLLYGTARPGGIVQYVSKRPQAEQNTEMTFSAGSYDLKRASIDSTGTLNDDKSVLYRLIATAQDANQTFHGRNSDVSYDERYIVAPTFCSI